LKSLYLLRHGHAEADHADDKARKLSGKGRQQVGSVAAKFQKLNLMSPTYALSSSAIRTHQTCDLILLRLDIVNVEIHYLDDLYLAREHKIIECIESTPKEVDALLYVGHNPGIEQCAATLCEQFYPMSPASMVCMSFDVDDWALVSSTSAENINFLEP
jgi:phosphohistidine phosphatase